MGMNGLGGAPAAPEPQESSNEKLEELKQKAESLLETARTNLINQFGSVDAARTYSKREGRDPKEAAAIEFAHENLAALDKVGEIREYVEQGHEDGSRIPPFYRRPPEEPTFEDQMQKIDKRIDRASYGQMPEAKGEFEVTREGQLEILNPKIDALISKYRNNTLVLNALQYLKDRVNSSDESRISDVDGTLQVLSFPLLRDWVGVDDEISRIEKLGS